MAEANALFGVIEKFVSPEINLSPNDTTAPDGKKLPGLSNLGMGYVFEEFESQIQTLQILRSTLIAHAVTGKIKV